MEHDAKWGQDDDGRDEWHHRDLAPLSHVCDSLKGTTEGWNKSTTLSW